MKQPKQKSALSVMEGVEQPSQINEEAVRNLLVKKHQVHTTAEFVDGIFTGNRVLLSRAITLVESALPAHQEQAQEVISSCLKRMGNPNSGIRIGITGVPGVGKSTFIEALGKHVTGQGHKLAVLAIDPSSTRTKGSILGDKTRMEALSVDPDAFIRPSPSAGSLGGVARKTRETIILCEAAGFDVIFIETVGVGQSETAVHSMVDFFLLLMLSGAGDELQGIKRGIIEMADAIFINKADGDNEKRADRARVEYANALHLFPPPSSGWKPVVETCSATTGKNIARIWEIIMDFRQDMTSKGYLKQRRTGQDLQVFRDTIEEGLRRHYLSNPKIAKTMASFEQAITTGQMNPYRAAWEVVERSGGLTAPDDRHADL
jgi:LAO/AO transport system kinase